MERSPRPSSWIEWYRFARFTLEVGHDEAVTYANVRLVEQLNRERLSREAA